MFVKNLKNYFIRGISAALLLWTGVASADWGAINLTQGVTEISKKVYDLHMLILIIVTIIAVGVFAVLFWTIFHHRKSKGAVAAKFHHNTAAEFIWTIIPIVILVGLAIPATKTLLLMEETGNAEMTIKVTGYQWKWKYDYMDEGISFFSALSQESNDARQLGSDIDPTTIDNYLLDVDNPVVVPIKKKIRILTTANDVIHAWWVPDLGWKRDAIPGFINDNWTVIDEPGTYRGNCAELCGKDHGFMPIVVKAVSEEEYRVWVDEMKSKQADAAAASSKDFTHEELMSRGEQVYATNCAACHLPSGEGLPGAFPALKGSAIATGDLSDHLNVVIHGKPGTSMQAFGAQLDDADLAAVITYERNAWGNDTGDTVQPADVKSAR